MPDGGYNENNWDDRRNLNELRQRSINLIVSLATLAIGIPIAVVQVLSIEGDRAMKLPVVGIISFWETSFVSYGFLGVAVFLGILFITFSPNWVRGQKWVPFWGKCLDWFYWLAPAFFFIGLMGLGVAAYVAVFDP